MTDADLAKAIVESNVAAVARLTRENEQLQKRVYDLNVHIKALNEMLEKRDAKIAELRLEIAKVMKGQNT